jgi:hypothetical protein
MSLTDLLWLALGAYGVHVLEEFELNWRDWARAVIGLPVEWADFYVVNSLVVVLGLVAAGIGPHAPAVSLAFPALMLINATFFHVLPVIKMRGRYSPGVFTAVVLFYPIAGLCYWRAWNLGIVDAGGVVTSFVIGALLMASPIVLLNIKGKPYFRQDL